MYIFGLVIRRVEMRKRQYIWEELVKGHSVKQILTLLQCFRAFNSQFV